MPRSPVNTASSRQLALVLSVDHRVIDGALTARWLAELIRTLEHPLHLATQRAKNRVTSSVRHVDRGWMARLRDIVFDCARPATTARFWAAALDGYAVAPYDDTELARLHSLGITSTEDDPAVLVESADGGPRLWFQLGPEPKDGKNRVHLDLLATDPEAEIHRLITLGATIAARHTDNVILADPEGNEFCLFPTA